MSDIVKREQAALVPMDTLDKMADAMSRSGFYKLSKPQAVALMLMAQAEGMHPAVACRDYHVIMGKPSKRAEAMLRDFIDAGGSVEWHESDEHKCSATFSHPRGGKLTVTWTTEMAKAAGLYAKKDSVWPKYPRQLLRARVTSEGVRAIYPAATSGMYEPFEQADIVGARIEDDVIDTTATVVDDDDNIPI